MLISEVILVKINLTRDKLYTTTEIAKIFGVRLKTVRNWIADGKLGAIKVGHIYRIPEGELREFMRRGSYDEIELS